MMPASLTHVAAIFVLPSTVILSMRGFAPWNVVPRLYPGPRTATSSSHAYNYTTSDLGAGHRFCAAYERLKATSLLRDNVDDAVAAAWND